MPFKISILAIIAAFFLQGTTSAEPTSSPPPHRNLLKLGVGYLAPNTSTTDLAGPFTPAGYRVDIEDTEGLMGSYTRFFGDHFGIETLIGLPLKFEVTGSNNAAFLGQTATVETIAPTILFNYYFTDINANWRPYVGLAANHTIFFNEEATTALETALQGTTDISLSTSTDIGAFAGLNYQVNGRYHASLLLGYVNVDTKGSLTTASPDPLPAIDRTINIDLNPVVAMASLGVSF